MEKKRMINKEMKLSIAKLKIISIKMFKTEKSVEIQYFLLYVWEKRKN